MVELFFWRWLVLVGDLQRGAVFIEWLFTPVAALLMTKPFLLPSALIQYSVNLFLQLNRQIIIISSNGNGFHNTFPFQIDWI